MRSPGGGTRVWLPAVAASLVTAAAIAVVQARPAAATAATTTGSTLQGGCTGSGTSFDGAGNRLQSAAAPFPPGSSPDYPFRIDYDGTVHWSGHTVGPISDHHWHLKLFGLPVGSGGSTNASHATSASGVLKVSDYLPFKMVGLYYLTGSINGNGGGCSGAMWVDLVGSPVGTVPWAAGGILSLFGLFGLFVRRKTIRGLVAGLALGIGVSALLLCYAQAPFGRLTPVYLAAGGVALGMLLAILAVIKKGGH